MRRECAATARQNGATRRVARTAQFRATKEATAS